MNQKANKQPRLVLGTVQLGLVYGAANRTGLPDEAQAMSILKTASALGIDTFDTARAYGDAERRIGLTFPESPKPRTVTKLAPLDNIPETATRESALAAARQSLAASRSALGRSRLDVVLLHRPIHRTAWNGAIWKHLKSERAAGSIGKIGVSVQTPEEAQSALADCDVAHLQLPFNLLDWRWQRAGLIDALRHRSDVTVHVRSVFLQGLLPAGMEARWPKFAGLDPERLLSRLEQLAQEFGREGIADLALAYACAQDWIDGVVIGMETQDQVAVNARLFHKPKLTEGQIIQIEAEWPNVPVAFLDPPNWRKAALNLSDL